MIDLSKQIPEPKVTLLRGRTSWAWRVAVSPDEKTVAVSGSSGDPTIRLFDSATGNPVGEPLAGQVTNVGALAWSHDGRWLAGADMAGNLRLWDVRNGFKGESWIASQGHLNSIAPHPTRTLFACGGDKAMFLFNTETEERVDFTILGGRECTCIAFSPDGRFLASGAWNGFVSFVDMKTGRVVWDKAVEAPIIRTLTFSSDGETLYAGWNHGIVCAIKAATGRKKTLVASSRQIWSLALLCDDRVLAVGYGNVNGDGGYIRFWDIAERQQMGEDMPFIGGVPSIVPFGSGRFLAVDKCPQHGTSDTYASAILDFGGPNLGLGPSLYPEDDWDV